MICNAVIYVFWQCVTAFRNLNIFTNENIRQEQENYTKFSSTCGDSVTVQMAETFFRLLALCLLLLLYFLFHL